MTIALLRPTLNEVMWATCTYRNSPYSYDSSYLTVLTDKPFLERLRVNTASLSISDVRWKLIGFLNQWGCRLRDYDDTTARNLHKLIVQIQPQYCKFNGNSILDLPLSNESLQDEIYQIFSVFLVYPNPVYKNFGWTALSKTLHVINPELFPMWDAAIRLEYWSHDRSIDESGRGYIKFMIATQEIAGMLVAEFRNRFGREDLASFLSDRLQIGVSQSLIKFIDEFNWVRFTRGEKMPKDWPSPL